MSDTQQTVYLVDGSRAVTGALVAASAIARALHDTTRVVLVVSLETEITDAMRAHFWRVERMPVAQLSRHFPSLLRFVPTLLCNAWQLKRAIARDGATILLLNDFYLMQGAAIRLLGFRGRILQWVRCDPFRYAGVAARPLLWCATRSANQLVAVSRHVQHLLQPHYAAALLYDAFTGQALAHKPLAESAAKTLLYIGNYIPGKGQDMAIAAFAIAAAHDPALRLEFHGDTMSLPKNHDYLAALKAEAERRGLSARIAFHGYAEQPSACMEHAYAAVNFSHSESFSMTVLEASGAGLPVIATASGGPQEILVDGVTGYLVPVGDVAAAAEAIVKLAANPAHAQTMGQAAAADIAEHFSEAPFRVALAALIFER